MTHTHATLNGKLIWSFFCRFLQSSMTNRRPWRTLFPGSGVASNSAQNDAGAQNFINDQLLTVITPASRQSGGPSKLRDHFIAHMVTPHTHTHQKLYSFQSGCITSGVVAQTHTAIWWWSSVLHLCEANSGLGLLIAYIRAVLGNFRLDQLWTLFYERH